MKLTLILILAITASSIANAGKKDKEYGMLICDEVTTIYDGDTFYCNIKSLHPLIGESVGIRVAGVDTPEMRTKCKSEKELARKAKKFTVAFLRNAERVELHGTKRGKFFRIVAEPFADGVSLSKALLTNGLAVPYDGGRKYADWGCD